MSEFPWMEDELGGTKVELEARAAVERLKERVRELEAVEAAFVKLLGILPTLTAAADSDDCVEHHAALYMVENLLLAAGKKEGR